MNTWTVIKRTVLLLSRFTGVAFLTLLLTACFVSRSPLITADKAHYPIASGTVFKKYDVHFKDRKVTVKEDSNQPLITLRLDAEGYYKTSEGDRFRLYKVKDSPYLIMMSPMPSGHFAYTLIDGFSNSFVQYSITAKDFERYKDFANRHPGISKARRIAGKYFQPTEKGGAVEVRTRVVEVVGYFLPHMVSWGFGGPISAFEISGGKSNESALSDRDKRLRRWAVGDGSLCNLIAREWDLSLRLDGGRTLDPKEATRLILKLKEHCGVSPRLAQGLSALFVAHDLEKSRKGLATACSSGELLGCHFMGEIAVYGNGGSMTPRDGGTLLRGTCHRGVQLSCDFLQEVVLPGNKERAKSPVR